MLTLATTLPPALAQPKHDKSVSNFDGGIFMLTDGELPGGVCFRVNGRVESVDFFNNLKREDSSSGSLYRRGNDIVTQFPQSLRLSMLISDIPCDFNSAPSGRFLTDAMIRSLRMSFYWKHGVAMRPAAGIQILRVEAHPVPAYFQSASAPAPQRFRWLLDFEVPSNGVPLTDSLVLTVHTPDHRIVARTAARM